MAGVLATSRRSPAALVGVFVALVAAATVVSAAASLIGTGFTAQAGVHRLAAAPVVVVGHQRVRFVDGHGSDRSTTAFPLTSPRGVPDTLAPRLAAVPGVSRVVADVSIPVTLLGPAGDESLTAHGWSSAPLTPVRLVAGRAPALSTDIVLTEDAATDLHAGVGSTVRVAGRDLAPVRVSGLVTSDAGGPGGYLSDAAATALTGTPGRADLLAVLPRPGTDASTLAGAVDAAAGSGYDVLTGADRGLAEDNHALEDRTTISEFGFGAGIPVVLVSLFVVAGAVGLALAERRRHIALLRAVGATPGQLRRTIARELALLGLAAGVLGYPAGTLVVRCGVSGLTRHDLLPVGATAWTAWWVLPIACGAGLVVAELSGFIAGWRASRVRPALALGEAAGERRRPHPVRVLCGLVVAGGGITLSVLTFHETHNLLDALNLAQLTLLTLVVAVTLLAPLLVSLAELLVRLPARLLGGSGARLASADMARRPRRVAPAVVAVATSVGFLGTVSLISASVVHAAQRQTETRLVADQVVSAPGGLAAAALPELASRPGVRSAVGLTGTTAYPDLDGGDEVAAAAVTPGPLTDVLQLGVVAGRLDTLDAGQVAVSQLEAGGQPVGSTLRLFLADGTPYRARISAIYRSGLGFGDLLLPSTVVAGHLGTSTLDQVLISGTIRPVDVTALTRRYPGLQAQSRAAANAAATQRNRQSQYLNNVVVALIAALATVTLMNALVTATLERRDALRLLTRVGTTRGQLLGMAWWQTGLIAVTGLLAGAAAAAPALIAIGRALTSDSTPYLPAGPLAALVGGVLVLTAAAIVGPTALILRRAETAA